MAKLSTAQFEVAEARGETLLRGPVAVGAHYDEGRDRVVIHLSTGVELGLRPKDVEGLENASPVELKVIEIEAAGLGIRFPTIDADLYVPALLEGALGSRRWMARALGAAGGGARSQRKAAAARENGRKSGRPRATAS
jgi:Protein of unknown function (DUF2442)